MKDTTNALTKNMVGGVCTIELYGWVFDLRWGIGLLIALMIADLLSGCAESRKKNIKIPKSRCIRRTLNKICDYAAVMMVFFCIGGMMVNNPVLGLFLGIVISCFAECCSVVGHLFYLKGIQVKFSFKYFFIFIYKVLLALVNLKHKDLGEALEKAIEVKPIEEGKVIKAKKVQNSVKQTGHAVPPLIINVGKMEKKSSM